MRYINRMCVCVKNDFSKITMEKMIYCLVCGISIYVTHLFISSIKLCCKYLSCRAKNAAQKTPTNQPSSSYNRLGIRLVTSDKYECLKLSQLTYNIYNQIFIFVVEHTFRYLIEMKSQHILSYQFILIETITL